MGMKTLTRRMEPRAGNKVEKEMVVAEGEPGDQPGQEWDGRVVPPAVRQKAGEWYLEWRDKKEEDRRRIEADARLKRIQAAIDSGRYTEDEEEDGVLVRL